MYAGARCSVCRVGAPLGIIVPPPAIERSSDPNSSTMIRPFEARRLRIVSGWVVFRPVRYARTPFANAT